MSPSPTTTSFESGRPLLQSSRHRYSTSLIPARKRATIAALPPFSPLPSWRSEIVTTIALPPSARNGLPGLCFLISLIMSWTSVSIEAVFRTTLPFHCRFRTPRVSPQTLKRTGSTTSKCSGSRPHTLRTVAQSGAFSADIPVVVTVPSLPFQTTPGSQPSACCRLGRRVCSISFCTSRISSRAPLSEGLFFTSRMNTPRADGAE